MRHILLTLFLSTIGYLYSQDATISLLNDSPFLLRVTVQSANGKYLGGALLKPGEFRNWTSDFKPSDLDVPGTPGASLTPFTVIWRCEHGGFYSMCQGASPGALIRANVCPGNHFCAPKEIEKKTECECICPGDTE